MDDTVSVQYRMRTPGTHEWSEVRGVTLPSWCSGDPEMAVTLYFFGERGPVDCIEVVRVI
jgi:hypothetical protein